MKQVPPAPVLRHALLVCGPGDKRDPSTMSRRPARTIKTVAPLVYEVKETAALVFGEGKPLADMGCAESIKARSLDDETLIALHTLVFGRRPKRKDVKKNLLQFAEMDISGEKRQKAIDKLAKWHRSLILDALDVLGVDRSSASFDEAPDKAALLLRLLEWLAAPTAAAKGKKRSAPKSKGKSSKKQKKDDDDAEVGDAEDGDEEAAPESELEALVLGLFTAMGPEERGSITIKQLMAKMKDKTGEDYAEQKDAIKAAWVKVFQEN